MTVKILVFSILGMLVPNMEIYSQMNAVMVHGGFDLTRGGSGSNLSLDYSRKLTSRWSFGGMITISNTYNRILLNRHESRNLSTFMDTRHIRAQGDLMVEYIEPDIVYAYENYGLRHTATKNEYSNLFLFNVVLNYDYHLRPRWALTFGIGTGIGLADRLKNIGSRAVIFLPYESQVNGIDVGSTGFRNRVDFSRVVKYLFWNSTLNHQIAYSLNDRLCLVQVISYQYDFHAATGIGGVRQNLINAGLLQFNLGIRLKI